MKTTTPLSNFVPSHDVAPNIYVMLKEEITIFGISLKKKKNSLLLYFLYFVIYHFCGGGGGDMVLFEHGTCSELRIEFY